MTIRQKLEHRLFMGGMYPEGAKAVLDRMVAEDAALDYPLMASRWTDEVEGYSAGLLVLLELDANRHALAWIDENEPKAWYRSVFDPAAQSESEAQA